MQNLIPANINLISGWWRPFSPILCQTLLPLKVTFTSSENMFFNESFIPASGELFLSSGHSLLLLGAFFLLLETMIEIRGNQF